MNEEGGGWDGGRERENVITPNFQVILLTFFLVWENTYRA